eukprot:364246-Chlamydomonas_euryale.AAC.13
MHTRRGCRCTRRSQHAHAAWLPLHSALAACTHGVVAAALVARSMHTRRGCRCIRRSQHAYAAWLPLHSALAACTRGVVVAALEARSMHTRRGCRSTQRQTHLEAVLCAEYAVWSRQSQLDALGALQLCRRITPAGAARSTCERSRHCRVQAPGGHEC